MNTELDNARKELAVAAKSLDAKLYTALHNPDPLVQREARAQLLAATKEVNRWMVQIQNHVAMIVQI